MYVSIQLCYKPPVFPCVFQYDYVLRIIVWQHAGRYSQTEHALALTNHSLCTIGFETAALEMGFLAPNRQQFAAFCCLFPFDQHGMQQIGAGNGNGVVIWLLCGNRRCDFSFGSILFDTVGAL